MRNRIMNMLDKHANMWDCSLGETKATSHRLALEPGARPYREMLQRTGPGMRKRIAEDIQKMLHAGVLEPATSEWASPVVLVSKKVGGLRFCVDYRRLNVKTLTDAYPRPRMNDCIDSLGDAVVFTTLDCNSGSGKSRLHRKTITRRRSQHTVGRSGIRVCRSASRTRPQPFGERWKSSSPGHDGRSAWSISMTSLFFPETWSNTWPRSIPCRHYYGTRESP